MIDSKKTGNLVKWIALIAMVLVGGLTIWLLCLHKNREADGIDAARTWARLAPFPSSASDVTVDTTGGMFTRAFTITFTAPMADTETWLAASPGTAGVVPEVTNGVRTYAISPGGGAQFAEVRVDETEGKVTIHTYWS